MTQKTLTDFFSVTILRTFWTKLRTFRRNCQHLVDFRRKILVS